MKKWLPYILVGISVITSVIVIYTNFRSSTNTGLSDEYIKREQAGREKEQVALEKFIIEQSKLVSNFTRSDSVLMHEVRENRKTFKTEIEKLRQQKNEIFIRIDRFNSADLQREFANLKE